VTRCPRAALSAVQARVAVLFASGLFAAFDLDRAGELWATHTTASAAAARVGRVSDVAWLPLPAPIGEAWARRLPWEALPGRRGCRLS
jgi:hypothetical protein